MTLHHAFSLPGSSVALPTGRLAGRPRVLFLHGFFSGRVAWDGVRRELGPGAETVAPDLLGYGRAPRPRGPYSLDAVVEHLAVVALRERATHVVGHSMGAIAALALARLLPAQFQRVGLIGLPVYHSRHDGVQLLGRTRGPLLHAVLQRDGVAHLGCVALRHTRPVWRSLAPLLVGRAQREHLLAAFEHCRGTHAGGLDEIVFRGVVEDLASVRPPVVALHGGRDRTAPLARVRTLAAVHGWELEVAPGATHQLILDRPRLAAGWVRDRVLAG
ncbi:MAG: alpha/beta hydrolase [Dehalococcoidia bacterium]|nr:alpha/beta hydrolase [Dehalococcoidia bacterium]